MCSSGWCVYLPCVQLVWFPVHSKERSGDWASQRSEHWNVEGGANVAAITFSWACGTQTMATCNCVICGSNLPSCKERRVLYSRESCHVVSTASRQGNEHVVPCHYLSYHTALLAFHVSISQLPRSLYNSTVDIHLYLDLPQKCNY